MRLRLTPATMTLVAVLPALSGAQAFRAGAEQSLDWPPGIYDAEGSQRHPSVAARPSGFLVVWESVRALEPAQVYAMATTTSGTRVSAQALPLIPQISAQTSPSVAASATGYVVVWAQGAAGVEDVVGLRVDDLGQPVDAVPFTIASGAGAQVEPSIACSGSSCMVAYSDRASGAGDIRVVPLDGSSGATGAPVALTNTAANDTVPSIAAGSVEWWVAWLTNTNGGDVLAQRLFNDGSLRGGVVGIETSAEAAEAPSMGAVGTGAWAVAWRRPGATGAIRAVQGNGAAVDPTVMTVSSTNTQSSPKVIGVGSVLSLAYHQAYLGNAVAPILAGTGLGTSTVAPTSYNGDNDIAVATLGQTLVVENVPGGDEHLIGLILGTTTQVSLSLGSTASIDVRLVGTSTGAVAVMQQHVGIFSTWATLRTQALSASGVPLSDAGQVVPAGIGVGGPVLAASGSSLAMAWPTWSRVQVAPLSAQGVLLDAGIAVSPLGPGVSTGRMGLTAGASGEYLVAWADDRNASFNYDVFVNRISTGWAPLDDGGVRVSGGVVHPRHVAAAFDGRNYGVSWLDTYQALEVAQVPVTGPIGVPSVRRVSNRAVDMSLTSGPGEVLLLWSQSTDAGLDVFAARLLADGGWPDDAGVRLTGARGDQQRAIARAVGNRYLLAFDSIDTVDGGRGAYLGELDFTQSPPLATVAEQVWSGTSGVFVRDVLQTVTGTTLLATNHFATAGTLAPSTRSFVLPISRVIDAGLPDAGPPDAGPPDAGPPDAGPPDAGPPDAGPPDAGLPDAGPPDAGPSDAGDSDSGTADAGTVDAGDVDAGSIDSGAPDASLGDAGVADAGGSDAGAPSDAGPVDAGSQTAGRYQIACGCQSQSGGTLALAALSLMALRRRARSLCR